MKTKLDMIEEIIKKAPSIKFHDVIIKLQDKTNVSYTSKEKSYIFTDMNIDKRFIHLGDNIWDLRRNHPYSKVHLPINEIYESQKAEENKVKLKLDKDIKSFVNKKE